MATAPIIKRNPMTADTEPTDEELALVMREAHNLVIERKKQSDKWMRDQMAYVLAEAKARGLIRAKR